MSEIKLLDLNNDWKQVRPSLKRVDNHFEVIGYQSYNIDEGGIAPTSDNAKLKFDLIKRTFKSDVNGKTVSDIGCSNMFFGFLSYFHGATTVTGVDLDIDYLKQNNQIISNFSMKDVYCKDINVTDYKDSSDTVFAFAIIHWVYSCSGFLGSLENVVKHFCSITNNCLYIEWIDQSDDCIVDMLHHLDFNKEFATQDYNKANFLYYLSSNFSTVEYLGNSKKTREIYRCLI